MERSISGDRITRLPSGKSPERLVLEGRLVNLEPLETEFHCEPLYQISHETPEAKQIWDYLPDGPFGSILEFKTWLGAMERNPDRVVFAARERQSARLAGMASY